MLKIRFQRTGRKNDPAYRLVVTEHTASPKAGKHVASVGSYHPKTKQTLIDGEAVKKWLSYGAKASGTVHNLLISQGIIEGKKVNVLSKKAPIVKEEVKEEEKPKEVAPEAPAEESSAPAPEPSLDGAAKEESAP